MYNVQPKEQMYVREKGRTDPRRDAKRMLLAAPMNVDVDGAQKLHDK